MKTFRMIGTALLAVLMCVNFASCSEDEDLISKIEIVEGTTLDVLIEDSNQLHVKYYPEYLDAPNYIWYSNNSAVVEIDSFTGKYVAKSVGKSNITVTAVDLQLIAECEITVNPIETAGITISPANKEMFIGENLELTVTFTPENATYKDIQWSSSDSNIATVDIGGNVKAIKEGECSIYAKTVNNKIAECKVVVKPATVKKVEFVETRIKLLVGDTKTLKYSVTPSYAKISKIEWRVEDESIASVSDNGIVTCKSAGTTNLFVIINEEYVARCQIIGCNIDEFVSLRFGGSSITNFNGIIKASIVCHILNSSSQDIVAKSIQLIDPTTGSKGNIMELGNKTVGANSSIGYTITINRAFDPIFRWTYVYKGKEYTIDLRYYLNI